MDGYEIGDDLGAPTGRCAACGKFFVANEAVLAADYMPYDRCPRCVDAGFHPNSDNEK